MDMLGLPDDDHFCLITINKLSLDAIKISNSIFSDPKMFRRESREEGARYIFETRINFCLI